jgi:hypothetical protein
MDVQLFIERANTLQEALATFVTPEVLDGGNQVRAQLFFAVVGCCCCCS